ncbi:hypothetical protein BJX99DRAFT_268685 [Aspergillus californicus]
MDLPCPPREDFLPPRGTADDEPPAQTQHLVPDHYQEKIKHSFKQLSKTKWFPFFLQEYPSLPVSNVPFPGVVSRPTPPRQRSKGLQDGRTRTRVVTNGVSGIDEQNVPAEAHGGRDKASNLTTLPPFDGRHKRHNIRIEALKKALNPMLAENGSAMVLVCWGEKSKCTISPIPVSSPEDEVTAWGEINRGFYTRRGYWRRYIPGFSVTRLDIVEISILGLKEALKGQEECEYIGMYTERDIAAERRRFQHTIDAPTPDCFYDRHEGRVVCGSDCPCRMCYPGIDELDICPVEIKRAAERDISLLNTLPLMRHAFSNPVLAASNDFLEKEGLVYGHWDVLSQFDSWDCPGLRELKFKGIVISEGWTLDTRQVILPLLVIMSLAVVVAAKFLFGWNTAWTVGGFFVALVTLLWMWANHMAS